MVYQYAVLGAGRIGAVHATAITTHPQAHVRWVVDPNLEAAEYVAQRGGGQASTDLAHVLADPEVDAVVVASPTPYHVEHALAAIEAGKHVLIEKPVAATLAEVEAHYAALTSTDRVVMVGFNRRFDPSFAEVKARTVAGEIGQLLQLTIISRDPAPPPAEYLAASGGIFNDMTIHDFDMARNFLGEVTSVTATGHMQGEPYGSAGDFGGAVVVLQSNTGAVATIVNSRECASGYDQRLEAFGTLGQLSADNVHATTVQFSGATSVAAKGRYLDFFLDRYRDAYAREIADFTAAMAGAAVELPSVNDGLQAMRIAEAATESAKTGRTISL